MKKPIPDSPEVLKVTAFHEKVHAMNAATIKRLRAGLNDVERSLDIAERQNETLKRRVRLFKSRIANATRILWGRNK